MSRRVLVHVAGRGVHVLSPRAECRVEPLPQLLSCHLISRIICCEHCTLPASLEARVWCVPRASVGSVWLHACSPLVQSNLIPLRRLRNPVRRVIAAVHWLSVPFTAACTLRSLPAARVDWRSGLCSGGCSFLVAEKCRLADSLFPRGGAIQTLISFCGFNLCVCVLMRV